MTGSSDRAWIELGDKDPYFGVLTDRKFRADEIEANREDFFESGGNYVSETLALIDRHCGPVDYGRALDFGCGVGRLTLPLARRFREAVGIDVSPGMIREAVANAAAAEVGNAVFQLTDDELGGVEGQFNFINTYIVLQHIPVRRGLAIIERLAGLLAPGGVASLHFTVDRQQGRVRDALYWAQTRLPVVHKAANLLRRRRIGEPLMQMNEYPLPTVLELLHRHGIRAPAVLLDRQDEILAVRLMGRKG